MEILILGFLHGGDFCIFGTFGNFCTLGISVVWEFLPGGFIFGIFFIGTLIVSVECKHADHLTTTLAPPPRHNISVAKYFNASSIVNYTC